ncbi:hypothetical protein COO60DRAFT_1700681 [Scenedesmus sp. NREL 46B-D3]|nr:hypothetical protein COO60DRAFT_1700681 [Scenedesmus sp. NREL 46B-D3]
MTFTDGHRNTAVTALAALQRVVAAKEQLLQQQGDDADWDSVAWTTLDSQALLRAVTHASAALSPGLTPNAGLDDAKALVQAASATLHGAESNSAYNSSKDSWLERLASVVLAVKASWEVLPEELKQADCAPLELVCSAGLLLVRLHTSATACAAASGTCQQPALELLRVLCRSTVQQLLQESLAGHLFIFRWHEQPSAVADLDAVMLRKPLLTPPNSSTQIVPGQQLNNKRADSPCSAGPHASSATGTAAQQPQPLPRLLAADFVPAAHKAWCGSFLLPLLPSSAYWGSGQEVLLGWSNACCRAEQLGLAVDVKPGEWCGSNSFMLALEGLWLFAQPPEAYLRQHSATPTPAVGTASSSPAAGAGPLHLMGLWPSLLLCLLAHVEAAVNKAAAAEHAAAPAAGTAADGAPTQPQVAAGAAGCAGSVQLGVVAPAAAVLFGMLGEALQHLAVAWQQRPAAARAALIRATIAGSQQPIVARQRRSTALLGKGKPKPDEVVCGQLLQMVRQLALLLSELLQLERSTCGGPQRDGTVPVTESGTEAVWFSSLWGAWPRGCCQALELLLRCPAPPCEPVTTLQELLLDDMWECLKALPLLDDRETAKAFTAAVVSSQKLVRLWQDAAAAVVLRGPAAASAAAAQTPGKDDERRKGTSRGSGKGAKGSSASIKAQQQAPVSAEAAGEAGGSKGGATDEAAVPAWLLAAAEADPQAALRAGLGLLYRLLDCAQKATTGEHAGHAPHASCGLCGRRWYTWWQQLQQCTDASKADHAAALSSSSSASSSTHNICASSSVWSGSSSFLSSSSESSLGDDEGVNDEEVNAAIEAASSVGSSTGSMSSCCAQLVASRAAAAAAAAQAAEAAAAPEAVAVAAGELWGGGAVQLAFGYSALAAPSFQLVDAVVKRGFAGLGEAQRAQQQEVLLGLLDSVSAGLASNSLILVELHRLGLLPQAAAGAAAAVGAVTACLAEMLSSALEAPTAAAAAAGNRGVASKAAAVPGSSKAKSAGKLTFPEPAASLDIYDAYWQGLGFEPLDQLKLSAALAGLAQQPVGVAAVGCHNPRCSNLAGVSERRLVTLACRACRQVAYCCRSCQALHWKAEGYCHRAECADLQEQQQAEWLPVGAAEEVFAPAHFQAYVLKDRGQDTVVQGPRQPGFSSFFMPPPGSWLRPCLARRAAAPSRRAWQRREASRHSARCWVVTACWW